MGDADVPGDIREGRLIYLSGKMWGAREFEPAVPGSAMEAAEKRDDFGVMMNPRHSSVYWKNLHIPWGLDNGAFTKQVEGFSETKFLKMLDRQECMDARSTCLFVVALDKFEVIRVNESGKNDDLIGDPVGTLEQFDEWEQKIHSRGYPVALVAQDGMENYIDDIPYAKLECIFLGGSTEWKLGAGARAVTDDAIRHGKWVHMGRVNSAQRLIVAHKMGVDSADGTKLRFDPSPRGLQQLLDGLDRIKELDNQSTFKFGEEGA